MNDINHKGIAREIFRINKITILNLIYKEREISRAGIAKSTGISPPTVSRIVDSLINDEKIVAEQGLGESSGGRPPVLVSFKGDAKYIIGIDWGRTHINGVIADLNAKIHMELDVPTEPDNSFDPDLENVIRIIEILIKKSGIDGSDIIGIGIAAAGYVKKESGIVEFSPNFNWKNVNIMNPLKNKFNVPIVVDNVSRVVAIGEYLYGQGRDLNDFIFINIGYGIGAGIISNGKPFYGFDGFAGEFGHNRVEPLYGKSRRCSCGKINCLECFSSGRGIAETMMKKMKHHPESLIHILSGDKADRINTELIARAAMAGDKLSREIITDAGTLLGISIANLANILNPEAVVLGGNVIRTGDMFIDIIKESFTKETLRHAKRRVRFLTTEITTHSAVKGAISLILKEVLNLNIFDK